MPHVRQTHHVLIACIGLVLPVDTVLAQAALSLPVRAATPLTIVAPEFPKGAVAEAPGIRIDVSGLVLEAGDFEVANIEAQAGSEPFVASVREVLKWWRFVPAIDRSQCKPKRSNATFAVWFEGTTDSPRVYFSFPKAEEKAVRFRALSVDAPAVKYSKKLLGVEGQVRVLRLIDPAGQVKSAAIRSSTPFGAFDESVLKAARATKVRWDDPAPTEDMCVEQTYQFCMSRRADASVEFEACK